MANPYQALKCRAIFLPEIMPELDATFSVTYTTNKQSNTYLNNRKLEPVMKKYSTILISLLSLFILSCSQDGNTGKFADFNMINVAEPMQGLTTGGQPSLQDLKLLAESGTKVVINLRTKDEFKRFDEKKVVEDLGMTYVSIEIAGSDGITAANAKRLDEALNNLQQPALVHCASSNRVGGLLAYRAFKIQGKTAEEAFALGKISGMSSTEKRVKKLLGL